MQIRGLHSPKLACLKAPLVIQLQIAELARGIETDCSVRQPRQVRYERAPHLFKRGRRRN